MAGCPSRDQLKKLLASALEDSQASEIDAHINDCSNCQRILMNMTEMAALPILQTVTRATAESNPSFAPTEVIKESAPAFLRDLEKKPPDAAFTLHEAEPTPDAVTALHDGGPALGIPRAQVPGFEILRELGRGGMGVVYQARQLNLNRLVAIKMILSGTHSDQKDLARFRAEAEAVARLQHPNIVQIFDVGEANGYPYFSLEYIEGKNLASALKGNPQSPSQCARLLKTVASAMSYCHLRGIVHRDLKPGNILLKVSDAGIQPESHKSAPGTGQALNLQSAVPMITDFGLAKRLGTDAITASGAILGTPSYMPPEQARGDISAVGPAADIYALGAILYEMLTGQPPFRSISTAMTLWQVVHEEPVPPSRLRTGVPADLEVICLTCLRKDPEARYASAQDLADDLQAYLDGLPIKARAPGMHDQLRGWLRLYPAAALFGGIGGMALVGVFVGLWFQSALTVGALAVVSLCLGAWWYSVRLDRALSEVRQQNLFYQPTVARMYLLLETVHRLLGAPSLDERLRILGEATARLVDAERATIYLIDNARSEVWSKVALGENRSEIRLRLGSGIAGYVAQTGELINISDAYRDPRFNPEVDRRTGFTTRNLLTVPMTDENGRRVGVFQVLNKRSGTFGSEDVDILSYLARSASLLIKPKSD